MTQVAVLDLFEERAYAFGLKRFFNWLKQLIVRFIHNASYTDNIKNIKYQHVKFWYAACCLAIR